MCRLILNVSYIVIKRNEFRPYNFTILSFRFCELVKSISVSSVKNIINNMDRGFS